MQNPHAIQLTNKGIFRYICNNMFKITINKSSNKTVETANDGSFILDGNKITPDIIEVSPGIFNIIMNNRSYNAEILQHNSNEKTFVIRVNNNTYTLELRDKYDELLKALGMDNSTAGKATDLKAPMPGLVVEVAVIEGQEVKKGDKLVVLEAMKMENILKATSDAIVKKVITVKGRTVEKNETLIVFS